MKLDLLSLAKILTLGSRVDLRLDKTSCTLPAPWDRLHKDVRPNIWNICPDAKKHLTWCDQTAGRGTSPLNLQSIVRPMFFVSHLINIFQCHRQVCWLLTSEEELQTLSLCRLYSHSREGNDHIWEASHHIYHHRRIYRACQSKKCNGMSRQS